MTARLIATAVFGGFGLVLFVVGVRNHLQQRRLLRNPRRVEATIVASEVKLLVAADRNPGDGRDTSVNSYRAIVRFRYRLDGVDYESDLLRPSEIVYDTASADGAREQIAAFPTGAVVQAYYQPSHPEKAFLNAEASYGPTVFIVLGLLLGPLVWFVGRWIF